MNWLFNQSALVPDGEGALQIARLSWLLFAVCGVIFLIVFAASWLAIRGKPKFRRHLSDPRAIIIGGIAFPIIVLSFLLGYSVWLMRADALGAATPPALRIHVTGEQWWWRIAYERPNESPLASANEIRIPVDTEVEFILDSADVIHSFWIPALGGKVDMTPGRSIRMRARATRPGIFRGQCAEYCGGPHAFMSLSVIAMPQAEFGEWMKAEAADAAAVRNESETHGARLFKGAGCGACHAVRGTEAGGLIGPDLTHFGSRRSLGAELFPMSAQNIGRFVAGGQHLKPGNRMPPFKIFSPQEMDALAAYLLGLR